MEHCFKICDPANPAAPAPKHLRKRGFIAAISVTVIILPTGIGDGESVYPPGGWIACFELNPRSANSDMDANGKMTFVRVSCRSLLTCSLKLASGHYFVPWRWINFYICYVRIIYTRRKYSRSIWTCWRNLTKLGSCSLKTPVRIFNGQVPGVWGQLFEPLDKFSPPLRNSPGLFYRVFLHSVVARSRMTKCEKLSGCLPFSLAATTDAGHDHELGTYASHPILHSVGLIISSNRRSTGIPRAVRIGITQQQRRAFGRNLKVSRRLCCVYDPAIF